MEGLNKYSSKSLEDLFQTLEKNNQLLVRTGEINTPTETSYHFLTKDNTSNVKVSIKLARAMYYKIKLDLAISSLEKEEVELLEK